MLVTDFCYDCPEGLFRSQGFERTWSRSCFRKYIRQIKRGRYQATLEIPVRLMIQGHHRGYSFQGFVLDDLIEDSIFMGRVFVDLSRRDYPNAMVHEPKVERFCFGGTGGNELGDKTFAESYHDCPGEYLGILSYTVDRTFDGDIRLTGRIVGFK